MKFWCEGCIFVKYEITQKCIVETYSNFEAYSIHIAQEAKISLFFLQLIVFELIGKIMVFIAYLSVFLTTRDKSRLESSLS